MQAPVEIRYEGAVLARGVAATGSLDDGGTLFLPLADPMPVGTRLELRAGDESALVRVVKVTESADPTVAGIAVRPAGVPETVEVFPEYEAAPYAVPTGTSASYSSGNRSSNGASRSDPAALAAAAQAAAAHAAATQAASAAAAANRAAADAAAAPLPEVIAPEVSAATAATPAAEDAASDAGPEADDTGSTSEYPALAPGTGAPAKRRQRKRKAK